MPALKYDDRPILRVVRDESTGVRPEPMTALADFPVAGRYRLEVWDEADWSRLGEAERADLTPHVVRVGEVRVSARLLAARLP